MKKLSYLAICAAPIAISLIACTDPNRTPPEASQGTTETSETISQVPVVEFISEARLPTGLIYQNTEIGGLSGITYDEKNQVYYAISDDRSQKADARFYTLNIENSPVRVNPDITVTTLFQKSGKPFAPGTLDPEGIALSDRGTLYISSEGDRDRNSPPFIKEFSLNGQQLKTLTIPEKFLPDPDNQKGVRNNLAFESLAIAPDNNWLFTGTENALIQDGVPADIDQGSPVRILKYNLLTGQPEKEFLYLTEPVAESANPPDSFQTNGLVELLAVNETKLLSLERSYSNGVGNTILLFEVSLETASDIQTMKSLKSENLAAIIPAKKRLLFDLRSLNIPLDNIEGMTFGPLLPDGRRSLILISDNNFNPLQVTQILVIGY